MYALLILNVFLSILIKPKYLALFYSIKKYPVMSHRNSIAHGKSWFQCW